MCSGIPGQSPMKLTTYVISGRFVKRVKWRVELKLMSHSKHQERLRRFWGYHPRGKFWDFICKILQSSAFLALVNAWKLETPLPCVPVAFHQLECVPTRSRSPSKYDPCMLLLNCINYTGWPKKLATAKLSINRIKSHQSLKLYLISL